MKVYIVLKYKEEFDGESCRIDRVYRDYNAALKRLEYLVKTNKDNREVSFHLIQKTLKGRTVPGRLLTFTQEML